MDFQLFNKSVIVTGASRGLGAAAAEALSNEGARVLAVARSLEDIEALAASHYGRIIPFRCDMRDAESVESLVEVALESFGQLDCVINNAGIAPAGSFLNMDTEQITDVFRVNTLAPALLARAAAAHFIEKEKPGSIINVGSTSSLRGKPILAAYSASKGALLRLTEALAGEWARYGIRVNLIAPGAFLTDAQSQVVADEKMLTARLRKIPLRRMGDPPELGPLVCYLASPLSEFVTGSCYVIDGGELAKL